MQLHCEILVACATSALVYIVYIFSSVRMLVLSRYSNGLRLKNKSKNGRNKLFSIYNYEYDCVCPS